MVLGEPIAPVAPALGVAREVERVPERERGSPAEWDRCEVEDGVRNHQVFSGGNLPLVNE
jgi:hypothetical protein